MNENKTQEAYASPKVKVIYLDYEQLICNSPTPASTQQYEEGDTSNWF